MNEDITFGDTGPNVIVLSSAGKPIFSRHGNEEDLIQACGLTQALLASSPLRSLRTSSLQIVILSIGSLTLLATAPHHHSSSLQNDNNHHPTHATEWYLRLQLEYVYSQIIFTLTSQVQTILTKSPNFDLRHMLGHSDNVIRSLLDDAQSFRPGLFLTGGFETVCPLPPSLRVACGGVLTDVGDRVEGALFGFLLEGGGRLVSVAMPRYAPHQLRGMDLGLILNFVRCQPGMLKSEAWFPMCLPRFNATGFVYAYTNRLHEETGLSLMFVSATNTTEQFEIFRRASMQVRIQLGIPISVERHKVVVKEGDSKPTSEGESEGDDATETTEATKESKETKEEPKKEDEDDISGCELLQAMLDIKRNNVRDTLLRRYCNIGNALHFLFRCDVTIPSDAKQSSSSSNGNGNGGGDAPSPNTLTQCLSPPLGFPFVDDASKETVWNVYQRLALRLKVGSSSVETCMEAYEGLASKDGQNNNKSKNGGGDAKGIGHHCPAIRLMETPPEVHGVTYLLDGSELYIGLNGKHFELYAVLPGAIPPRIGTAFCAKLVRKLMGDEKKLFLAHVPTFKK